MSAYFDSLNRRAQVGVVTPAAPRVIPAPVRRPVQRLTPSDMPPEYARLREKLMVAANGKPLRTLVFAGCNGAEGCTRVVREFAEVLASSGMNVLLVDADMRTSGLTFSIEAAGEDLKSLVEEGGAPAVNPWGKGQLGVVPTHTPHPDKEQFFRAAEFADWLKARGEAHDYVLLDAPPLLRFAEGTLIGRVADGVILVAHSGATDRQSLVKAREQLERAEVRVVGVVLNRTPETVVPNFLRPYISVE
jgi:Mrp family chromosome partitioning ATPase